MQSWNDVNILVYEQLRAIGDVRRSLMDGLKFWADVELSTDKSWHHIRRLPNVPPVAGLADLRGPIRSFYSALGGCQAHEGIAGGNGIRPYFITIPQLAGRRIIYEVRFLLDTEVAIIMQKIATEEADRARRKVRPSSGVSPQLTL